MKLLLLISGWITIAGLVTFFITSFIVIFETRKESSRHRWWTPSGFFSRTASFMAQRWADSPNDFFPIAVFAYGMTELFGLRRSVKILVRFHAKQTKKLRQRAGVRSSNSAANSGRVAGA